MSKIGEFTNFIALIYITWRLKTSDTCNASYNDINLSKNSNWYAEIKPLIFGSALCTLGRHLWHLCSKLVPLSMFSLEVEPKKKNSMGKDKDILVCQPDDLSHIPLNRFDTRFGKPHFPDLTNISTGVLSDLIDIQSRLIFHLLAEMHHKLGTLNRCFVQYKNFLLAKINHKPLSSFSITRCSKLIDFVNFEVW